MAAAVETTWRASTPDSVDDDLAALWRSAGDAGPVSRALMSNLVIVSTRREFPFVEELARKHPARTVLLSYTPGLTRPAAPETVRVGLHTFGDESCRYGLEFIAVHTACADAALPSIVRRLTIGSVPTSVWWTADLSSPQPPEALSAIGRQLVYDSASWADVRGGIDAAGALLTREQPPDLADLNWRRIAPVREAIVHALRVAHHATAKSITSATIVHAPGEHAAAWLAAGWLRARAGVVATVEAGETDEVLTVDAKIDASARVSVALSRHCVRVANERAPFVVPVPDETVADAVAAELIALSADAGLCDALRALRAWQR
jgi:glucose-6-phosphate dehydrogenase assembly protein OpcA